MANDVYRLENVPNEIFIEIFKYLDIRDLFRAFDHLNSRLYTLLHSLNYLCLTLSKTNCNLNDIPTYCVSTLMITEVQIDLDPFLHIRCLILIEPKFGQIYQLSNETLPRLEHLLINFRTQSFPYDTSNIYKKIFSNEFPHLKYFHLPKMEVIMNVDTRMQTLSLRNLNVGKINIFVYKAILASCPNLYFLKFVKNVSKQIPLPSSQTHMNLKKMTIELLLWGGGTLSEINAFLSYVPALEHLRIHHAEFCTNINGYLSYDWLSSSIVCYLPLLSWFSYTLEILYYGLSNRPGMEDVLTSIKEHFKKIHGHRYQSQLTIIERL